MKRPISPQSKAYKSSADKLGFHAVCLIGWEGPHPMSFGDNQGGLFVRATTTKKEMTAADKDDVANALVPIVVHEYVYVASEKHAARLKKALDEVLIGQQEELYNSGGRHNWRNVRLAWDQDNPDKEQREHDRARWWSTVLGEALDIVSRGATEFEVWDEAEDIQAIITERALRGY